MAAEKTDGTLAAALQAAWSWLSANVMTTKTVKLTKVFPLPEPDIILIIVPSIVPYLGIQFQLYMYVNKCGY